MGQAKPFFTFRWTMLGSSHLFTSPISIADHRVVYRHIFAGPVKKIRQELFGKEFKKSASLYAYQDNGTKKHPIVYSVDFFV
jgi:hypothetical protein